MANTSALLFPNTKLWVVQDQKPFLKPIEEISENDVLYSDKEPVKIHSIHKKQYKGNCVSLQHNQAHEKFLLHPNQTILSKPRPKSLGGNKNWAAAPRKNANRRRELRNETTPSERKLWRFLKGRSTGVKFRRQHSIGPYIADFYCREAHLAVEIDGDSHFTSDALEYDRKRDLYFRELGLEIYRVSSFEVNRNAVGVAESIQLFCEKRIHSTEGAGCRPAKDLHAGDLVFRLLPEDKRDQDMRPPLSPPVDGGNFVFVEFL